MELKCLLKKKNIKKAIIIDDGVDPIPFVSDLDSSQEEWTVFWDDLTDADQEILDNVFPGNKGLDGEELIKNQDFITAIFESRDQFSGKALSNVFGAYLADQDQVGKFLASAKTLLEEFDLEVELVGRDFRTAAETADVVILDLFLGSEQTNPDKKLSVDGISAVLKRRKTNPPAIILTSAHQDLAGLRDDFRDDIGVLASGFRTLEKKSIETQGHLERLIFELIAHRDDVQKLSAFLGSWEASLENALSKALIEVRKLDLEDIAHLQDLLLKAEGVSIGSYMVDVMDRVFQHEIESEQGVIDAAKHLNELEAKAFPPNSISGSKDTLSVVYKTLFSHDNRRSLDEVTGYPMSFGDILGLKVGADAPPNSIFEGNAQTFFVMMTPICDLVREQPKAKRSLLLAGTWTLIDAAAFSQNSKGIHTPVVVLNDGNRAIINWNLKHLETVGLDVLSQLISDNDDVYIAGRLRESTALSLQQQLLSDMGRVGELAVMPSMFPVTCNVHYVNANNELTKIELQINGVCVIGRDKPARIAFDTSQRDRFKFAVDAIVTNAIGISRDKVRSAISPASLDGLFTIGFAHNIKEKKPQPCKIKQADGTLLNCGQVILNEPEAIEPEDITTYRNAGLTFKIHETPIVE